MFPTPLQEIIHSLDLSEELMQFLASKAGLAGQNWKELLITAKAQSELPTRPQKCCVLELSLAHLTLDEYISIDSAQLRWLL